MAETMETTTIPSTDPVVSDHEALCGELSTDSMGSNPRALLEVRKSTISGIYNTSRVPIRKKDIVKIFSSDGSDGYLEVTPEQLGRVKFMHEKIEDGTTFSFNYNCMLFVASMLAGLGLISNSTATIIASMLVSPIMGPVIGLAYGSTIRDWKLVRKSFIVEIISLLYCITSGVLLACVTGPTEISNSWPTQEMIGRGTRQNFLVALPVAFFSGLGVAVSVLDDQSSSLVGVAISASLLPPAVNAGILWVAFFFSEANIVGNVCDQVANNKNESSAQSDWLGDEHAALITTIDCTEAAIAVGLNNIDAETYYALGFVSLMVTFANIALIWISSMLMFRMKEVLPIKKNFFWDDLRIARKVYQSQARVRIENVQASDVLGVGTGMSTITTPVFETGNSSLPEQNV